MSFLSYLGRNRQSNVKEEYGSFVRQVVPVRWKTIEAIYTWETCRQPSNLVTSKFLGSANAQHLLLSVVVRSAYSDYMSTYGIDFWVYAVTENDIVSTCFQYFCL